MERLYYRSLRRVAELIYCTCRHRGWMPCGMELNAVRAAAHRAARAVLDQEIIDIIAGALDRLESKRLPVVVGGEYKPKEQA